MITTTTTMPGKMVAVVPLVATLAAVLWTSNVGQTGGHAAVTMTTTTTTAAVAMDDDRRRQGDDDDVVVDDGPSLPGERPMEGRQRPEMRQRQRSARSAGSAGSPPDDLIVSASTADCPSDCAWMQQTTKQTDAFVYPVARVASPRQPFPPNQRDLDLGGVTAAVISIDGSPDEGDLSGSDLCSPDDEDCHVFSSGSGIEMSVAVAVVTSGVSNDDIVYMHRSTETTENVSNNTAPSSSNRASLPPSTSFSSSSKSPSWSTTTTTITRDAALPTALVPPTSASGFDDRKSSSSTSSVRLRTATSRHSTQYHERLSISSSTSSSPSSSPLLDASAGFQPDPAFKTTEAAQDKEEGEGPTGDRPEMNNRSSLSRDHAGSSGLVPTERHGMIDQLAMNIGLILGIAIALILLLAMLAFVLFQYRTGKEAGNQSKMILGAEPPKTQTLSGCGGAKKALSPAARNSDTTGPPGVGGKNDASRAAQAPSTLSSSTTDPSAAAAAAATVATNTKRKDVKEWYV